MHIYRKFVIAFAVLFAIVAWMRPVDAQPLSDQWSAPTNLNSLLNQAIPINSTGNDQHPAISHDGLSLYFGSDRGPGCGGLDLWVTHRASVGSPWGKPVNLDAARFALGLPCLINSNLSDNAPNLSPDGRLLFFHSFKAGGCGGGDLYFSVRDNVDDDFSWQAPINMNFFGREPSGDLHCGLTKLDLNSINTTRTDAGPLFFYDQLTGVTTLYFTRSDLDTNLGDFDVFTTTLQPDGTWGNIAREGDPLTTPFRDTRTAIRHDGLEMILSTERPGFPPNTDPRKLWTFSRNSTLNPWTTIGVIPTSIVLDRMAPRRCPRMGTNFTSIRAERAARAFLTCM